jgi:hypothetical protein
VQRKLAQRPNPGYTVTDGDQPSLQRIVIESLYGARSDLDLRQAAELILWIISWQDQVSIVTDSENYPLFDCY